MQIEHVLETIKLLVEAHGDKEGCVGLTTGSMSVQFRFGNGCSIECGTYNNCQRCLVLHGEVPDGVEIG